MVPHEHVGMDAPAGLLARFRQRVQEALAIPVIPKDRLPVIAASHHVIDGPGVLDANRPRHNEAKLSKSGGGCQAMNANIIGLTPSLSPRPDGARWNQMGD